VDSLIDQAYIITHWLGAHRRVMAWLGLASLLILVATLVLLPWLAARVHPGYFTRRRSERDYLTGTHPLVRALFLAVKNIIGVVFIALGVAMLFLPGQGLITILAGIMLTNFPGKHALERWIIRRPGILRAANWLRSRGGVEPLLHPDHEYPEDAVPAAPGTSKPTGA